MSKVKHWSKQKNIWLIRFKSSNLKKVGYDVKNQILYIQFKNKTNYKYTEVPIMWFVNFTLAKSKGKYFSKAKYELVNFEKLP
jgi:hypothetical protein